MKREVSSNIRRCRFFFIPVIAAMACVYIQVFLISEDRPDIIDVIFLMTISLVFLIISYFLFQYFDNANTIAYDNQHLYISNKNETKMILLERIISLKMTTAKFNNRFGWKITYMDVGNIEKFASFFPKLFNRNMENFSQKILEKNKDAKIQKFFFGPFQINKSSN